MISSRNLPDHTVPPEEGRPPEESSPESKRLSQPRNWRSRLPWVPLVILFVVMIVPALFADVISPHDPIRGNLADRLTPPVWAEDGSFEYLLGTDKQGRDILTRTMHGARISLAVSLSAVLLGASFGTFLGLVAGYFGGFVDQIISYLVDTFFALPLILTALVIASIFGPSFYTAIAIVSILIWARFARQVRGEVLSLREADFVSRARVAGASSWWIIRRHILPNVTNTLVVLLTLQVGLVIILESSLSFLGAGIPRPNPSWGVMVADGRDLIASAWWMSFFPGLAILMVVMALNLLGDWLRDRLDPRLRQGL